ncbi:nitric oxide synthase-like isoform X2 [Hyposmocoma kahamanoa]|uniref:nitric oxide synthase-like isoform X2 n=1 Tax=Hyposmocoma kahamanoa TaxID=1477025 RepID=UPI000E6D83CF|nr:nitric oxide synthase-like isoform X2 [Hyposmocoma kahamanoa]
MDQSSVQLRSSTDSKRSGPDLEKMGQINDHSAAASDSGKPNGHHQRQSKKSLRVKVPQPIKLKNHMDDTENFDVLHSHMEEQISFYNAHCTERVCQGSVMNTGDTSRGETPRSSDEVYEEAQSFYKQYFESIRRENSKAYTNRLEEVRKELKEHGTYQLKSPELVFAAKTAWRNAQRCIGRIQWKKIQIFDCREVTTARGMFEALCTHIKYATNKGNIRAAITIFPQRTDGKHDYRIWNHQLIAYAGYVEEDGSILGDPARVEFTEICIKLGWKPAQRTAWDVLPLVLSADGKDPEFFELPRDIIMEINLEHPLFEWFKDLDLRWYAVPAVSNMKLDCGGLEFTATAFNGWYMSTEIGCRNLCDTYRLNVTEKVAIKMGLDTNSYATLWKDRALVEVNVAVLHSFHRDNVSIVDHHSASEQFMKHLESENKTRRGCPSDWIWIVPPMSSSLTPVFHQEMALYFLRPSYDYQEPAWKVHQWKKADETKTTNRKFHFKQIARAVKFTSKLFGRALSKRIKATILYATETGRSEQYAKELGAIFGYAFNAQVHCMSEYDMFSIEHETLLLIVTSTFGNGEPPDNGLDFAEHLFQMLYNDKKHHGDQSGDFLGNQKLPTPKSLMRTNSVMTPSFEYKRQLSRMESNKSSIAAASSVEHIGPLSNVCYAVFALGSSAYPKFCNFGKTVDKILYELGGDRILDVACGDELLGQEQEFRQWSSKVFHVACETFCLDENDSVKDAKNALGTMPLTEETVKFAKTSEALPLKTALETGFRKHLLPCKVKETKNLIKSSEEKKTIFVDLRINDEIKYDPGDHVGVMARNRKEIVDTILEHCKDVDQFDRPVQLQILKETLTPTGTVKSWESHERIPPTTIRDIFTSFLDISTPPSTKILKYLAKVCSNEKEAEEIKELITDPNKYDDWRHFHYPHLAEVLQQFPSCKPQASLLAILLPPLQPRFYSISSSPLAHKQSIHLTVAVVTYKTQNGKGPTHYGVASTYLEALQPDDDVLVFIRRAPSFHMPKDISAPLIMVGPGSGIAPFRGFWHHRRSQMKSLEPDAQKPGPMWLFFGCRHSDMELYKEEKEEALSDGVLTNSFLALSRKTECKTKYVQDLIAERGPEIASMLLDEQAHFYVCGDCKMAEEVQQKLRQIMKTHANLSDEEVENCILEMMDDNRYHEDIFGITLRTAEVQSQSRESAKNRLASAQSQS